MLRSTKELIGKPINALDGEVGKVDDFLFDDQKWGLRYLVASTGGWLSSRKVLISPRNLLTPELGAYTKHFPVDLTKQKIDDSPPLEKDAPVSQQFEEEYATYYAQPPYWSGAHLWGLSLYPGGNRPLPTSSEVLDHTRVVEEINQRHLRSINEVLGYNIEATDGEIGHIEDFIVDIDDWKIRHFVVDTRNWLPGKKVLIGTDWINGFHWSRGTAEVAMAQDQIKSAPEFDATAPVNRGYEQQLYDFYGQPYYW